MEDFYSDDSPPPTADQMRRDQRDSLWSIGVVVVVAIAVIVSAVVMVMHQ